MVRKLITINIDTFYNDKMVIDEIANYELFEVLYSRKPVVIINEMWRGKYENDIFMKYSLWFRIVRAILIKNNDFVHYYPNFIDEFKSLYWLLKPKSKEWIYHLDKKQKAHMFMFKSWKSSMNLRYILDAIFILIIAVVIQIQISKFQNQAVSYYSILGDYNTKKNALLDTTLTASQRTAAQTAFNEIELKFLNINNNAYDKLILIYYMNLILLAYPSLEIFDKLLFML